MKGSTISSRKTTKQSQVSVFAGKEIKSQESNEDFYDIPQGRVFNDDVLFGSRYPSYTKFQVPYKMICKRRYIDNMQRYEKQIQKEILQYIDFQSTASDALFLVRCMAITSLWPPLYSRKDLRNSNRVFNSLKPKERTRLNIIMNTNII